MNNEEWVTMKEASERLGIGRNKISRLATRKIIELRFDLLFHDAFLLLR